jgi:CRISPR-associated endonuclease Cas2
MFKKSHKYSKKQIKSAMNNLKHQKLIEYVSDKNGVTIVRLTTKGKSRLMSFSIDLIEIKKPKSWDGKWRLVMFDLPIKYTKARNSLRFKLKQLGFIQFQKSVWIYPYDCEDLISLLKADFKIGKDILYMIVEKLENDWRLRKSFNLPNSNGRKS